MGNPPIIIRRQPSPLSPELLGIVTQLLKNISYGSITLVVQDGVVLQVNSTEKLRLKTASPPSGTAATRTNVKNSS